MEIDVLFPSHKKKLRSALFIGPPGTKIDPICNSLSLLGDFYYFSFKETFKQLDLESPLGLFCQKYNSKGIPLPDAVAKTLWEGYLQGLMQTYRYKPQNQLLLLEGFPFNIDQAKSLDSSIEVIFVIYLITSKLCGSLEGDELHRNKIKFYNEQTIKILDFYPESTLIPINGDQKLVNVFKDILMAISSKI
jgi:adenylate kinase family enzyme